MFSGRYTNLSCSPGSLPEEYEPDQVLRASRFLGKEAYRPVFHPTGAQDQPTGRELPGHWRRQAFGEGSLSES
jgi:hypothetical protein